MTTTHPTDTTPGLSDHAHERLGDLETWAYGATDCPTCGTTATWLLLASASACTDRDVAAIERKLSDARLGCSDCE